MALLYSYKEDSMSYSELKWMKKFKEIMGYEAKDLEEVNIFVKVWKIWKC